VDAEGIVTALVAALQDVSTALVHRAAELGQQPGWSDVSWAFETTRWTVPEALGFSGYVDGEREGVGAVNWTFDAMREGDGWTVDRDVHVNADNGPGYSELFVKLPDVRCGDTDEFARQLPVLIAELLEVPSP
jgi:hypothetical protein